jgi:hypothetical protein
MMLIMIIDCESYVLLDGKMKIEEKFLTLWAMLKMKEMSDFRGRPPLVYVMSGEGIAQSLHRKESWTEDAVDGE